MTVATGLSCGPLPDGSVLIEFHGEDGETVNAQAISGDVFQHLPFVLRLMQLVLAQGGLMPLHRC